MKRACCATASLAVLLVAGVASAQPTAPAPAPVATPATPAPVATPAEVTTQPPVATPAEVTTPPAPAAPATTAQPTTPAPAAPVTAAQAETPAPASKPAPEGRALGKKYTSWDANIEGGVGRVLSPGETTGLGRVRAGVLVIRDPSFFAVGVTYELSHLSAATLGLQGEYMHLESGVWVQGGPLVDVEHGGKLGFMGSLGISLFGVEYQGRDYNDVFASAIFGKIRIPIGIIGFGLRGR